VRRLEHDHDAAATPHPLEKRADRRQRGHPHRCRSIGAAFAGSWAIATLLGLGTIGARLLDGLFVLCGIVVMVLFMRSARRIEPFVADEHRPLRR
jgi:hypothetical protein